MSDISEQTPDNSSDDSLDIDAALASVASLSDAVAEHEAQEAAEEARIQAAEHAAAEAERRRSDYYFAAPPALTLRRGQLASVIPAFALIGVGIWLTFSLASDATPDALVVVLAAAGGVSLSLLAYWLSSERWSIGALFSGLLVAGLAGMLFYLAQSGTPDQWPLLLVASGGAAIVSGLLSRGGRYLLIGLVLIAAGLAGTAATTGALSPDVTRLIDDYGLIALGVVAALLLLPSLFSRRA